MLEEELTQLRSVKEELQTYAVLQKKLMEQQQEQVTLLEKHNRLQEQMDLQRKLIEQQQEHVSLLEKQNHLQEQQINALREKVNDQQEQSPGQINHLSPGPKPAVVQLGKPPQKSRKEPEYQQGRVDQRLRSSSPLVVIGLVLLVLLLLGGSLGIYSVAQGHLPWLHATVPNGHSSATTPTPSNRHSSATTSTPLSSNSSNPSALNLNAVNIHAQIGNLLIQSSNGFQCPYSSLTPQDLELGHLVLASDRTTYSQAEIKQMSTYLTYYIENGGVSNRKVLSSGTEPPSTLRWVLGGQTTFIPGTGPGTVSGGVSEAGCNTVLTLTNTGITPIQVSKVGVQLKASPQQNTYHYHLIDACSLNVPYPYCPPTGEGGGGACSVYSASIQLGQGKQNDVFSAVPTAPLGCSTLTIASGTQVTLDIAFSLNATMPQNSVYTVLPVFTVNGTQGVQTLAFPQLGSTLAFASASQFSCYRLQDTTFVLMKSPVFSGPEKPTWCL